MKEYDPTELVADTVRAVWVKLMKEGRGSAAFRKIESITGCPSRSDLAGNVIV